MKERDKREDIKILKTVLFLRILFFAAVAALVIIFFTKFLALEKNLYSPQKNLFQKRVIFRICKI